MEPAALEGAVRGRWILQIAHHHRVAGQEDLAHGLAVARRLGEGIRIGHHEPFEGHVVDALAGGQPRALLHRPRIPFIMPGTDEPASVALRKPIAMEDAKPAALPRPAVSGWGHRPVT